MAEKKVISIRFDVNNQEDMELYHRLELEAGNAASLASIVKVKIRDCYNSQERTEENNELQDKLVAVVREEMQASSLKLVGAIFSGITSTGGSIQPLTVNEKENLPEKSEDLPVGALDFLN